MQAWEQRRRTFERTALAYDRYRPGYPAEIFEEIRSYADLAPDDAILEIGCGTGRATVPIARWGNPVHALEPAEAMAAIARRHTADFPLVDIRTERLEEAELPPAAYGLVVCAQAYHWLDAATREDRIARALYAHGTAAILDNVQVTPARTRPFWDRVQSVYLSAAPALAHKGAMRAPHELPAHPLTSHGAFADLRQVSRPWSWTLPTRRYIDLLATHSGHAALNPGIRAELYAELAGLIDGEFGGSVTEHYVCVASLARRAPT